MALLVSDLPIEGATDREEDNVVTVTIWSEITEDDCDLFVPRIQRLIEERGKLRLLVKLLDFNGWSAGVVWDDTKFATTHFNDVVRLAIVGDKSWQEGVAPFCKPFPRAAARYFDMNESDEADAWLRSRGTDP
jgi:hypothetical protein